MTDDQAEALAATEGSAAAQVLRHWAARTPDAPMLTLGDRTLTWGQVYANAKRVSHALAAEGVVPGERVAFLDRNSIEFFEVFFGCALLGAVSIIVNWRLAPAEMAAIVEDAQATVLFYGDGYTGAVKDMAPLVTSVRTWVPLAQLDDWRGAGVTAEPSDPGFEPGPGDVVTQLYTSGTTGLPKGVMISGRNLSTILGEAANIFQIGPDTVSLVAMPLFHIGGTGWALAGMSRGGHSVIIRDIDPVEVLRVIEEHRITEKFVVPAVLMFLLATPEIATTDVSSLRTVFYGASPISEDVLVRSMEALGCDFAQVYGLTETTGARAHTCCARPGGRSTTWSSRSSMPPPARPCRRVRSVRSGPDPIRTCSATGTSPKRPPRCSRRDGCTRGTPDGSVRTATCSSTTGSRT